MVKVLEVGLEAKNRGDELHSNSLVEWGKLTGFLGLRGSMLGLEAIGSENAVLKLAMEFSISRKEVNLTGPTCGRDMFYSYDTCSRICSINRTRGDDMSWNAPGCPSVDI